MSVNTFNTDLTTAAAIMVETNPKAERLLVIKAIVEATDPEVRDDYVFTYTAGYVRRGFRQMAIRMERKGNQDAADVFWALRDDIDPYTDSMFRIADAA